MRAYKLLITDPLTNKPIVDIDSSKDPFQIETSFTYTCDIVSVDFFIIKIINFKRLERDKLIGGKFTLIAGQESSDITNIISLDSQLISPKQIMRGYVYDCYYDMTKIPDNEFIIKVSASSTLYSTLNQQNKFNSNKFKPTTITLPANSNIIDFLKKTFKQMTGEILINATGINNITYRSNKPYNFVYDPRSVDIVNALNNFISILSESNSKLFAYPLSIVGGLYGYEIRINYLNCTTEQIEKILKESKRSVYTDPDINSLDNVYFNAMFENTVMNNLKSLNSTLMIKPPIRTEETMVQIHTTLLPSIKPGSIFSIGDYSIDSNNNLTVTYPNSSLNPQIITRSTSYFNNTVGPVLVNEVSHNLNFYESSPVSWSTVINAIIPFGKGPAIPKLVTK